MSEFAKLLQKLRKEKGLTLEELANKVDVGRSYLSKLENDKVESMPSEELLKKISTELNSDYNNLLILAGRMPKQYIKGLDLKKVELFRTIGDKKFTDAEYKHLLSNIKNVN